MAESSRIDELRRRVQTDPASIAFAALAEEYRRAGLPDEAIATCVAGLKRHPAYVSARVTLGRALLETGRLDEARIELEAVLRVAPENLAAIRALADIHHRTGEAIESPASPEPAPSPPLRLVSLSSASERQPPAPGDAAPAQDRTALPALEALLDAIQRVRTHAPAALASPSAERR